MTDPWFIVTALASGLLIGTSLSLIGGGGSILAVPLLLYVVKIGSPHLAIGTAALAVAISAATSLVAHMRAGTVKWRCASVFAASGLLGAWAGSSLGKAVDGTILIGLFGVLMIGVGLLTWRRADSAGDPDVRLTPQTARRLLPRLVPMGFGAGGAAGFFGIGGGFLIAPGLMGATAMPMRQAIGTSLVAVTCFGLVTAGNYALAGDVSWTAVVWLVIGGAGGVVAGRALSRLLETGTRLTAVFAIAVILTGLWMTASALV